MFDIRLDLGIVGISYEPEIAEDNSTKLTVRNVIRNWINDFFNI